MSQLTSPVPKNENAERIVREAWEMFQQRGYRGVSVAELCERCAITKPTLYYYFRDKETLFIHVVLRQLRGYRTILATGLPLQQRLTALAAAMLSSFETDISVMMRDMAHIKDPANRATVYQAFQEEVFGPLVDAIAEGLNTQDCRQAEFYAWAYLGLVNTFVGKSQRLATPPEMLAQQLVEFFFQGAR